ncbi:hypothetical protein SAMN05444157_0456 [Frankineae bacterium MT45]|nr:hypothetical protein SAMN05444157_0456 [Frankineae bacterium MT45]
MGRPRLRLRTRRSVAGLAVVGLAAGVTAILAGGTSPAAAAAIDATVPTTCTIPVAGAESYDARISATIPDGAVVGDTVSLQNFKISIVLNVATTDALQILGATTLEGSITAGATLTNASPSNLSIVATVPVTPVPQTQDANGDGPEFTITASGPSPTATLTSAGTAVLTATTVNAVFNPKNAAGASVLPAAKQIIPCKFNAGDNLVLASIPVSGPLPPTPVGDLAPYSVSVQLTGPSAVEAGSPATYVATSRYTSGPYSGQLFGASATFVDDTTGTTLCYTSGPCVVTFPTAGITHHVHADVASHFICCVSSGDPGYVAGPSNIVDTEVVPVGTVLPTPTPAPGPPTPSPAPTPTPLPVRQHVTLTGPTSAPAEATPFTYTATTQLPVGRISFYDGTTLLVTSTAASGTATSFTERLYLSSGTHNLIATTESWNGLDYGGRDNVSNTLTVVIAPVLPTPLPPLPSPSPTPVTDLAPWGVAMQLQGPSTVTVGTKATYAASAYYTTGPLSGQAVGQSLQYIDEATGATLCDTSGPCDVTFPTAFVTHHVHAFLRNTFTCCVSSGNPGHTDATSNTVDTVVVPGPVVTPILSPTPAPTTPTPTPAPTPSPTPSIPFDPTPSPSPAPHLTHIDFTATGTIGLPTVNGTGKVGPGTISTDVNLKGGSFTGTSSIPDITVNASLFGFIPTTIVSSFTQVGLLTGQLAPGATDVTADLKANLGVKSVKALGVLPLTSGNCSTASPVSIHLASNGKGQFSPFTGGTLSSTFAIGKLANCGLLTDLLNAIFPGNANTLTLKLAAKGS